MRAIGTPILRLLSIMPRTRAWLLRQPAFTSTILPAIPRPIRWFLRRLYALPLRLADRIDRREGELVPPRALNFTGSIEGFRESGNRLVRLLTDLAGLEPSSRVLDVGCGLGRLAVPLTGYLEQGGSYEGLDIVESAIEWCNENIASQYANFRFTVADVFNHEYNPGGRYQASEYRFPYDDEAFDLVVLASVFTHMVPEDMSHYVAEVARVLAGGGRCFATYFLINEDSLRLSAAGKGSLHFKHDLGTHWLVNPRSPELSVGYEEESVRDLYGRLFADTTVHYGGWCGRPPLWSDESGLGDQDVVVATKDAPTEG